MSLIVEHLFQMDEFRAQLFVDLQEILEKARDQFMQEHEIEDGLPAEPCLEILADSILDSGCVNRLIYRINETLMHLAVRCLIDREAQLHKETLNRLKYCLQQLL